MADPVAYSMWAPQVAPLDLAPITRAGEATAAAYHGVGIAIGKGIEKRQAAAQDELDRKRKDEAGDAFGTLMDDLQNPKNVKTETVYSWHSDPSLAGFDEVGAATALRERALNSGMAPTEAEAYIGRVMAPSTLRYYSNETQMQLRGKFAKAMVLANKAGLDMGNVQQVLNTVGQGIHSNQAAAMTDARDRYMQSLQGTAQNQAGGYQSVLQAEADRQRKEAAAQAHRDNKEMQDRAALQKELGAWTEFARARSMAQFTSNMEQAIRTGDKAAQTALIERQAVLQAERDERVAKLSAAERAQADSAQHASAVALADMKAKAGEFTDDQREVLTTAATNWETLTLSGATDLSVPLTAMSSMVGETAVDDWFQTVSGAQKARLSSAWGAVGAKKSVERSGVQAYFKEDGQLGLRDVATGDKKSELDPTQLESLARSMFRSDAKAKAMAVLQMVNGGLRVQEKDVENLLGTRAGREWVDAVSKQLGAKMTRPAAPPKAGGSGYLNQDTVPEPPPLGDPGTRGSDGRINIKR